MTRQQRATRADLLCIDLIPACPDCADLAHPGATVCAGCGTHLFPKAYDGGTRLKSGRLERRVPQKEMVNNAF